MPTPTPDDSWSLGMLHEYIERVLDERDRTYQLRWEADQRDLETRFGNTREQVSVGLANQEVRTKDAFVAQERSINQTLSAAQLAVSKAENAAEKRFDAIMTTHQQLNIQIATFLPRAEFDRTVGALTDKIEAMGKTNADRIEDLRTSRDKAVGAGAGLNMGWGFLIAAITVVILIVQTVLTYHGK